MTAWLNWLCLMWMHLLQSVSHPVHPFLVKRMSSADSELKCLALLLSLLVGHSGQPVVVFVQAAALDMPLTAVAVG